MISAYIQIILMLLGAFLLGIFVAWQYWRKKQKLLQSQHSSLEKESSQQIADLEEKISDLEKQINKKDQQLEEGDKRSDSLHDEIEALEDELASVQNDSKTKDSQAKTLSYYKQIHGQRYKAITLRMADEAIKGQGDGRISKEDAKKIFDTISDGRRYTPVEKVTMRYIRENYKWTDGADHLFRHYVGSWAAHDHNVDEITE